MSFAAQERIKDRIALFSNAFHNAAHEFIGINGRMDIMFADTACLPVDIPEKTAVDIRVFVIGEFPHCIRNGKIRFFRKYQHILMSVDYVSVMSRNAG